MNRLFLIAAILVLIAEFISAQNNVEFSAQVRPGFEIDSRDFNESTDAKNLGSLRSRAGIKFIPSNDLEVFFQIQDSRDFGFETNSLTNMKNLDLHQAYVKMTNLFDLPIDLKLGRQEVTYGSGRFFGTNNWNNVGRALDGLIVTLKGESFGLDFIAIKDKENYQFGDSADVDILALFADLNIMPGYKIEPFIMWQKNVPVDEFSRLTAGIYTYGTIGGFTHEIDFGYQFGELTDYTFNSIPPNSPSAGTKLDISAYIFSATVGYNFNWAIKPGLNFGIDILSGDGDPQDKYYNVYASPYGDKHKFYGFMDYFTNNPLHTGNLGLIDFRGGFSFEPIHKLNIKFDLHLFNTQEEYTLNNDLTSTQFGTEGDLTVKYIYSQNVVFQTGASMFIPGEIFEDTKGKDNSSWFYLMTVVTL
ncbi:MAG: alginate export family protein [Bacteroidota bacterium]